VKQGARCTAHHGAERLRQSRRCRMSSPASPAIEVTLGRDTVRGAKNLLAMCRPTSAPPRASFLAFPVSGGNPGRRHHDLPAHRFECAAQGALGESEFSTPDFLKKVRSVAGLPEHSAGHAPSRRQCRLLPGGEKKRNEIFADGAVRAEPCASWMKWISGLDIGRASGSPPTASTALRASDRCDGGDHALSAAAQLHRAGLRARDVEGPRGEEWRQGAGAGVGRERLRAVRRRRLIRILV